MKVSIILPLVILLFFGLNSINGQEFHKDSLINNFIKKLHSRKIDSVIVYEKGVVGAPYFTILLGDTCRYQENKKFYIFWRTYGEDYLKKINYYGCYEYDSLKTKINFIWDKYAKNEKKLKKEEIKMPSIIKNNDTITVGLDHYSYKEVSFYIKNRMFDFEIDDFYFSKTVYNSLNLNYHHNLYTMRKKLHLDIDNLINDLEEKKLIKKTALYKNTVKLN